MKRSPVTDSGLPMWARARTLVGEFILIVAGVTVALGAESLWDIHQDHVREGEYLTQLREDLVENEQRLGFAIDQEEQQGAAALAAFEAVARGEVITVESARAWLVKERALFYSDPRLLTGTFSGIVDSGDLRLIRSPAIRTAILAYPPQIEADRAEFDRWVGVYVAGVRPLRVAGLQAPVYDPSIGGPDVQVLATNPGHPSVLPALDQTIFANQVRLIYLRRMLEATDSISQVLSTD